MRRILASIRAALACAVLLASFGTASAQQATGAAAALTDQSGPFNTTPTVDRDRTDRVTPVAPTPPTSKTRLPTSTTKVDVNASTISLTGVRFQGATLRRAYLQSVVAPFIGRPLSPEALTAIATAVGKAYAKSDVAYYAVVIPPQMLSGGVLLVNVTEGMVTSYTLNGVLAGRATPRMAAQIAHILHSRPLSKTVLERALSLMRDLPGRTVDAQMRQIGSAGALRIDITVKRKVGDISIKLDNDGVANVIDSFQMQVAVAANNLLRDGDRTQISSYLPIHPDRYQYYSVSHTTPIGDNGLTFGLNGAYLRTRTIDRTTVGTAKLGGLTLNYPIIRSYKTNLSAIASLDGVDSSNYFLDTRFGDYRARALRLGASWSKADEKNGYAANLIVSRGIDALGARAFVGFSEKEFTKVNVQLVAVRTVAKNVTIKVSARGQYSNDMLPVTERASIGGEDAGRGFRAGTVTGEKSLAGVVELAWTLPIKSKALKGTSVFAFGDGGVAKTVARPYYALAAESYALASVGAGVRFALPAKMRASVEVAVPLKRPQYFDSRKARVFFGIGRSF